jgi:hypothetical protein
MAGQKLVARKRYRALLLIHVLPVGSDVPSDAVAHHSALDGGQLGYQHLVVLEVGVEDRGILLAKIDGDPLDVIGAYVSHECHLK